MRANTPARWCRIAARALDYARVHAFTHGDPDAALRLGMLASRAREEAELHPDQTLRLGPPSSGRTIGWYLRNDPHVRAMRRTLELDAPETGPADD